MSIFVYECLIVSALVVYVCSHLWRHVLGCYSAVINLLLFSTFGPVVRLNITVITRVF